MLSQHSTTLAQICSFQRCQMQSSPQIAETKSGWPWKYARRCFASCDQVQVSPMGPSPWSRRAVIPLEFHQLCHSCDPPCPTWCQSSNQLAAPHPSSLLPLQENAGMPNNNSTTGRFKSECVLVFWLLWISLDQFSMFVWLSMWHQAVFRNSPHKSLWRPRVLGALP